jgi:DNA-binding transcriptional MerR regulator
MAQQERPSPQAFNIGELSAKAECPVETIRYYERAGYLPAAPRSQSGRRVYSDVHVERLRFIRRARELGFSLDRARLLLELSQHPGQPCSDALAIATAHLAEVRRRRAELEQLENALARMVAGCHQGTMSDCSILQPLAECRAPSCGN